MKGMSIAIVAAIVIAVTLGFYYFNSGAMTSDKSMSDAQEGGMEKGNSMNDDKMMDSKMDGEEMMDKETDSMMESSHYLPYKEGVVENLIGSRRVLFFYANWCPTCKPVNTEFEAGSSKLPEDVFVIRVNYNDNETDNSEKSLAAKYGVTYQHTFVEIDDEGEALQKWNGGGLNKLLEKI